MHIEKLLLRDVGPLDDVTIEFPKGTDPQLADVYLLTGPNGTGKSTILYALTWLIGGLASDTDHVELALPSQVRCSWMAEDGCGTRTTGPDVRAV